LQHCRTSQYQRVSLEDSFIDEQLFRDAMARWPAGVAIVAFRDTGRVVATTVSAFISLSTDPPSVLVALGPNATVRPFLTVGAAFGISILTDEQRRLASIFADPLPVGAQPFAAGDVPLVEEALARLHCRVSAVHAGGSHAIVTADVQAVQLRAGLPLIRYDRAYRRLAE
jgi:flavin reductase (DIM6/NTAB) family NADH-FMN oxidoreductase RutF